MSARGIARYRELVVAIGFFVLVHALGIVTMGTLLRPGMDAASFDALARMHYIAEHPWAWRLGWLPWQLCAVSDLVLHAAWLRWISASGRTEGRSIVVLALLLNLLASVPEQWAEARMVTHLIDLAQGGDFSAWSAELRTTTFVTAVWAGGVYTAMTAAWMVAVRRITGRGAWGAASEIALLIALAIGVVFTWRSLDGSAGWFVAASVAGAFGFPGVTAWVFALAGALGAAHRAAIDDRADARLALRWPAGRALKSVAWIAADGVRDVFRLASRATPFPRLRSDITDVVYLTWLVPTARVAHLAPAGTELDDFDGATALSILIYRHGHFGPALLGPLRRLLPSPPQSNVRLHLAQRPGTPRAVVFLNNTLDQPLYAIGSRIFADGLPAHLPKRMAHARDGATIAIGIEPGDGTAVDLKAAVEEHEDGRTLAAAFGPIGAQWEDVVRYLVPQEVAIREHAAVGLSSSSSIVVGADLASVRPARVIAWESAALREWVGERAPLAFVIPTLRFEATGERWTALPRRRAAAAMATSEEPRGGREP